jgi:hypothetical protein
VSNRQLQDLLKRKMSRKEFLLFSSLTIAASFGIIGVLRQLLSQAATPAASFEGEGGTETSPAAEVTDASASAGKAVKFSAAQPPDGKWTLLNSYPMTSEPAGTTYSTGVRTTDQSSNRKAQVVYGNTGMMITAERASAGATIYSADVKMQGISLPNYCAVEVDVELLDYLGTGMFPAVWSRPLSAGSGNMEGERDYWEYCGAYIGQPQEWKSTMITTPYGSGQGQAVDRFAPRMPSLPGLGLATWRTEITPNTVTVFRNGTQIAQVTAAMYAQQEGSTGWTQQFETANKTWYPRFTYQIGNGANASLAGPIPTSWTRSRMRVSNLKVYKYNG